MTKRYNHFYIAKKDGGQRHIASPTQELKDRSWKILEQVNKKLEVSGFFDHSANYLHSYLKNRGCSTLVNEITDFVADTKHYDIISMDVVDYFGSITFDSWHQTFDKLNVIVDMAALDITREQWMQIWDCVWVDAKNPYKGIAQGNPLSPMISNLVGWGLIDKFLRPDLNGLNQYGESKYWRYSDNIFIVVKRHPSYSRSEFLFGLSRIIFHKIPGIFRLKINVKSKNERNIVLGIRVGKKAQLKDKKWLRSVFHRYAIEGVGLAKHQDIIEEYGNLDDVTLKQMIQGLAAYALDVDPGMRDYITRKLGDRDGDQRHRVVQQEEPNQSERGLPQGIPHVPSKDSSA